MTRRLGSSDTSRKAGPAARRACAGRQPGDSGTLMGGVGTWGFEQPLKYFLGDTGLLKPSLMTPRK